MKRFMTLLLALTMVFCLAACSQDPADTSSAPATSSEAPATSSEAETSSEAPESSVTEESSEAEPSEDSSVEESSEPELDYEVAEYITQYISWKGSIGNGGLVGLRSSDATSIRLTSVNVGVVDGTASIAAFNSCYEDPTIYSNDGSYADYEVFVFEYDHATYSYKVTASYGLDAADKDAIEIPDDGYVVAIHSHFADYLAAIKGTNFETDIFYPHGFRGTSDVDAEIYEAEITVDGMVSKDEYGASVWLVEQESELVSYEQFTDGKYYSTAEIYLAYDETNLYIGVVVNSPYHINTVNASNAKEMYNSECIQVNVSSVDPVGEYLFDKWDNIVDSSAQAANVVRQYGFCVNDDGETHKTIWMGNSAIDNSNAVCVRDDDNQITYYEIAIPLTDCGAEGETIVAEKGTVIGVSVSVNSGDGSKFKNIYLRDGGGIIGLNDWTKMPSITLG